MSAAIAILTFLVAVALAAWAGLLALAEEAPAVARSRAAMLSTRADAMPLAGAVQGARVTMLVLSAASAAAAVGWWLRPVGEGLLTLGVTVAFLLILADILPRGLGALFPAFAVRALSVARRTLGPFRPLLSLIAAVERGLQMLLPPPPTATGSVSHEERDLMAGVLSLGTETVADVMTPRLDIEAIDSRAGWREVVERLRQSEHARLPVYQDDLDDIVGILYAKDVAPIVTGIAHAHDNWRELLRPAQFVPESKPLASQLYDFQRSAGHLAIVVDEFGGTSGLVTLEDVLEEVVGEIHGEYDANEEPPVVQEGEDRYWVDGAVTLDTLAESLGIPIERDDISTVGGLIYSELGHVPKPGEELTVGDFRVVVEKVVQRRIHRVYFERRRTPAEVEPEAGDRV